MKKAIVCVIIACILLQLGSIIGIIIQPPLTTPKSKSIAISQLYSSCDLTKIENRLQDMQSKIDAITKVLIPSKGAEKNCAEYYKKGVKVDGIYSIDPDGKGSFKVYCDMTTSGGGWTVFQRRFDGSVDFYRGWQDYKKGFGELDGEFWLGLEKIHRLTRFERNRLRIDLGDTAGNMKYAEYSYFAITSEKAKYQLSLGIYSGTAGDSLTYHRGMAFSTKDLDNDNWKNHCAESFKGAWWHNNCLYSNLNGMYYHGTHSHKEYTGVTWYHWKGDKYSLKNSAMKIRPESYGM